MKIKVTHPIKIGDRVVMPGETIDAPEGKALEYIGNEWAIELAEVRKQKRKKEVKHDDWQNDPEV